MAINRKLAVSLNPMIETRDVVDIKNRTGNLYGSIVIMAKRANQINVTLKDELHRKLEDFASHNDSLEEIHENKEQIEISRFYERMANPAIQAIGEFNHDKIYYRKKDEE